MHIKNVALLFYLAIGVLMALLLSQAKVQIDLVQSASDAEFRQDQIRAINELLTDTLNMETGVRGYLLTRNDAFLAPYHLAIDELDEQIKRVNQLFRENTPERQDEIRRLLDLIEHRIEISKNTVKLPPSTTELQTHLKAGKETMDQIRQAIQKLVTEKNAELIAVKDSNAKFSNLMIWVTVITSIAVFMSMFFASNQVQFEIGVRAKSERDLKVNLSYLRTLTSSIPSGVVSLDKEGRITFANQRSSELLNFNPDRAIGQSFFDLAQFAESDADSALAALKTGESFEREMTLSNGAAHFPTKLNLVPLHQRSELVGAVVSFQDLSREKDIQAELVAEKESALHASRAKSAFLSQMSHEFRTPLNAIIGMGDMLLQSQLSSEQRKYAGVLTGAAQNLLRLINDVLDLSKIESGKLELDIAPFKLGEVLEECVKIISFKASEKGLSIALENRIDNDAYMGDSMRLHQVMMNLLGNAIKFTDKGSILVEAREERGMVRIDVTDTGKGIAPDKLDRIFEKYAQENSGISRTYGGTGLGLSISREIANLMGGNLTVSSIQGKGSTFTLTIRLKPYEGAIQTVAIKEIKLEPMNLLLVDDNPDNRLVVVSYLKSHPVTITEAADGTEAVTLAMKNKYDLIFMDMHMPKMDGYEATQAIRGKGNQTPIVALTAYALKEEVTRILSVGCQDRLAKPITRAKLLGYLAQFQEAQKVTGGMTEEEEEVDESLKELIPQYLERRQADIPKVTEWAKNKDAAALRSFSHNLRGTALSYGQPKLDAWAKEISHAVQDQKWDEVQVLADMYSKLVKG